jgi:hypothetical protein
LCREGMKIVNAFRRRATNSIAIMHQGTV